MRRAARAAFHSPYGQAGDRGPGRSVQHLIASAELEPSAIQDLGDLVPRLLEVKARAGVPIRFRVQIEVGDGKDPPGEDVVQELSALLAEIGVGLVLE